MNILHKLIYAQNIISKKKPLTSAPLPKISTDQRKAATAGIKVAIKDGNALLKKLDGVVKTLLLSNRPFYNDYFDSRTRNELPTRVELAVGKVIDADGNPIPIVTMTCEALGIKRKISQKGGFIIRNAPDGIYQFVFSRTGYVTVMHSINIYAGARTEVLVTMHLHV